MQRDLATLKPGAEIPSGLYPSLEPDVSSPYVSGAQPTFELQCFHSAKDVLHASTAINTTAMQIGLDCSCLSVYLIRAVRLLKSFICSCPVLTMVAGGPRLTLNPRRLISTPLICWNTT